MSRSSLRQSLARSDSNTAHLRTHIHNHPHQIPQQPAAAIAPAADLKKRHDEQPTDITEILQTIHIVNYVRDDIAISSPSSSVTAAVSQPVDSLSSDSAAAAASTTALELSLTSVSEISLVVSSVGASATATDSTAAADATSSAVESSASDKVTFWTSEQTTNVSSGADSAAESRTGSVASESSTISIVNDVISGISYTGSYFATGTAAGSLSPPYPTGASYNITLGSYNSTGVFYNSTSYSATGSVSILLETASRYSTGDFSTSTSTSTRSSSTTSESSTSTSTFSTESATATATPTATATAAIAGVYGSSGSDSSASATTSSSNKGGSSDGGLTGSQTTSVIGGVVGGMAGIALIMVLVMMVLRYKKNGGQIKLLDGSSPRGLLTAGPGTNGGPGAGSGTYRSVMSESSANVLASFKAVKTSPEPSPSPPVTGTEPAFVRVSGRKLPSVLEHGGDGYSDPRASVMSAETVNYRDSTFDPAGLSPDGQRMRFALGSPMRPMSGVPVLRDSPARSIPGMPYMDESGSAGSLGASSMGMSPPESPAEERKGLMVRGMPPVESVGRSLTVVHPGVQRHSTVGHFSEDV